MTTPTIDPAVASAVSDYIADVRGHLDDLDRDDRDDLVDGLDADLLELGAELADERSGEETLVLGQPARPSVAVLLRQRVGEPADYARELRAAAGLPPRGRRLHPVSERSRPVREWVTRRLESPAVAAATPVLRDLRPAWWVLRAWVAVQTIDVVFDSYPYGLVPQVGGGLVAGSDLIDLLVLAAVVVVSVQIGRGAWLGRFTATTTGRGLLRVGNVLCVLALLFVVPIITAGAYNTGYPVYAERGRGASGQGLILDGQRVSNVFAYGPDGQPLTGVRLYDQDGEPLTFDRAESVPVLTSMGEVGNIAPLPVATTANRRAGDSSLALPPPPLLEVGGLQLTPDQRQLARAYGLDAGRATADEPAEPNQRDEAERRGGGRDRQQPDQRRGSR